MKKILILEDARIGGQVKCALEAAGIAVSWFVGVKSLETGKLVGFTPELKLETVDLSDYELAFVDGFLYLGGLMGWELLPDLKAVMHTVGTSSLGGLPADEQIDKEQMLERALAYCKSAAGTNAA